MKKRFFTLFPTATNTHLGKDVGQIPYQMARLFGFEAYLVTESTSDFESIGMAAPLINLVRLKRLPSFFGLNTASFLYVMRNAARIDVLNLYHMSTETKLLSILYKRLNPSGFLYIKLDVNVQHEKKLASAAPAHSGKLKRYANRVFLSAVDLFSAESEEAANLISRRPGFNTAKIIPLTNGVDLEYYRSICPPGSFAEKENLMITVGRLGAAEKNTELLLSALRQVDLKDWRVALIGPFTEEFQAAYERLVDEHPALRSTVSLVGNVTDRKALLNWYRKAKVFLLTSRSEGFPLVFSEAQCYGNYLISTDVASMREITRDERYGKVFDDADELPLSSNIQQVVCDGVMAPAVFDELLHYAHAKYDWKVILQSLHERIAGK